MSDMGILASRKLFRDNRLTVLSVDDTCDNYEILKLFTPFVSNITKINLDGSIKPLGKEFRGSKSSRTSSKLLDLIEFDIRNNYTRVEEIITDYFLFKKSSVILVRTPDEMEILRNKYRGDYYINSIVTGDIFYHRGLYVEVYRSLFFLGTVSSTYELK